MYGKKKKIVTVLAILIILTLIGCVGYFLLQQKNNKLEITYVGGDKYVDDVLTIDDFEVMNIDTGKTIEKNSLRLSIEPLNINGTVATITYINNGKKYTGTKVVYPTLVIEKITAELIAENKHVGSKISKKDFKVTGINNKKEEISIENFKLSHTMLKNNENDIKISYETSVGTISTTLHLSVTKNFIVAAEAKYTGDAVFVGEKVDDEDFEVYAIWDDETKTKVQDYEIDDPTVSDDNGIITVTISDEAGNVFYTDVKVKTTNYVIDIDSVSYIGQEQTVGNTLNKSDFEVYGIYYDGKRDKVENFKIRKGKNLKTTNNSVEIEVVNEMGDKLSYITHVKAEQNIIYVGDSRINDLKKYLTSENVKNKEEEEKIYYVYDNNANLDWFNTTGISQVQSILDKNPYTTFRIVLTIGMFDTTNVEKYLETYSKLAKTTWKDQKMYINSLNPIDEEQLEKSKVYSRQTVNSTSINEFNKKISQGVSQLNLSNLKYVNTYGVLTNSTFKTTNGYNYEDKTYEVYHENIKTLAL